MDRTGAYAVIGAGPHGLSALKALLQNGIDADGFEREAEVGGNWNFGAGNSRVYQSTHLISSKPFTQFPDFPMPDRFPDFPSHPQVKEYFGLIRPALRPHRPDPVRHRRREHRSGRRRGDLAGHRRRAATGRRRPGLRRRRHRQRPQLEPEDARLPGPGGLRGEIIHSADYKGADVLRGRRVVVVGAGNTGCDVAVESAQNAAHTWHSTRRGYYYNPKYLMGRPTDQTADLLLALRLPLAVRRRCSRRHCASRSATSRSSA